MSVSKAFQNCIELIYSDIYEISLGICSRRTWYEETYHHFLFLLRDINYNCHFSDFDLDPEYDSELLAVYLDGTLFKSFLHFFYCERSCENVSNYCKICSRVRQRQYQNRSAFIDVKVLEYHDDDKVGLQDRELTFDIFMDDYDFYSTANCCCRKQYYLSHSADILLAFLSLFARIQFNNLHSYFGKIDMCLNDEKYCSAQITKYIHNLMNAIYSLNINYFYVIFGKFESLNHSSCYGIAPGAKETFSCLELVRKITDEDQYEYKYQLFPNQFGYCYENFLS